MTWIRYKVRRARGTHVICGLNIVCTADHPVRTTSVISLNDAIGLYVVGKDLAAMV
jgi:hypothetical protein